MVQDFQPIKEYFTQRGIALVVDVQGGLDGELIQIATQDTFDLTAVLQTATFTVPANEQWEVVCVSMRNNNSNNRRTINFLTKTRAGTNYTPPGFTHSSGGFNNVADETVAAGLWTRWEPGKKTVLSEGDQIACSFNSGGGAADACSVRVAVVRRRLIA